METVCICQSCFIDLDGVQMREYFAQVLTISVGTHAKVIGALYTFTLSICAGHSSTVAHDQASSGQACLQLLNAATDS